MIDERSWDTLYNRNDAMGWSTKKIHNLSKFTEQQHALDPSAMSGSLECLLDFPRVPISENPLAMVLALPLRKSCPTSPH